MSVIARLIPIVLLLEPVLLGQTIESVSPQRGSVGTRVSIRGSSFLCSSGHQRRQPWFKGASTEQSPGFVEFSGTSAEILSWEDRVIWVHVPPGARSGPLKVILPYCVGIIVLTSESNFQVLPGMEPASEREEPSRERRPGSDRYGSGFKAFLTGEFDEAIRNLDSYLKEGGADRGRAYFYVGAAKSAKYYLGGEKDRPLLDEAQKDFQQARRYNPDFDPPRELISPRILTIYETAAPKSAVRP